MHLAPPLGGVTPFEFRKDFWLQKTRLSELACGVVCMLLCLAILVELRLVSDRQTDIQTKTQIPDHGRYRAQHSSDFVSSMPTVHNMISRYHMIPVYRASLQNTVVLSRSTFDRLAKFIDYTQIALCVHKSKRQIITVITT